MMFRLVTVLAMLVYVLFSFQYIVWMPWALNVVIVFLENTAVTYLQKCWCTYSCDIFCSDEVQSFNSVKWYASHNVETSYFTQLKICYLMTTFRCPSDILITSWLFTVGWSTWPGNLEITLCKVRSFYVIDCTNWMNLCNTNVLSSQVKIGDLIW